MVCGGVSMTCSLSRVLFMGYLRAELSHRAFQEHPLATEYVLSCEKINRLVCNSISINFAITTILTPVSVDGNRFSNSFLAVGVSKETRVLNACQVSWFHIAITFGTFLLRFCHSICCSLDLFQAVAQRFPFADLPCGPGVAEPNAPPHP